MKLFRFLSVFAVTTMAVISGCKEDIDFAGETVQTPIVYCLLNQADSIHYVKITRTFSGTNNALEVAQIPDSSYYQQVDVQIQELINGVVQRTWTLNDTLLENKQPGVFFSPEQKVYFFKTSSNAPLNANATYKLTANINNGEFTVTGTTALVKNLAITTPSGFGSLNFITAVNGQSNYNSATVKASVGTARIVDCRLRVFMDEYIGGVPTQKSFEWKVGEINGDDIDGTTATFLANGQTFFTLVKENVTNDANIDQRQLAKIQIVVTGGTDDLSKYILVNQPSSSLAQNKPTFTNLTTSDGRPVIGLFSARHTIILEKLEWVNANPYPRAIDKNSTKELCTGTITGGLSFCSDHPSDIAAGESYVCQ